MSATLRPLPFLLLVAALGFASDARAQAIRNYTESSAGPTSLPLGYPVPQPVASLEAVDGFRDYASLQAKLQAVALASADVSAHEVGTTQQYGRTVWAYRVSDEDAVDVEGAPEAAFFINNGTHAREWGTQEIGTWLVERMAAGANDGGVVRYLLDNTRLVTIPVHNIDGFLQTQRFPTQVIVGQDPTSPSIWPRDGRMRRKNMRGTDEVLTTFGDHLNGIDLNRNHPAYFGGPGSSGNPAELTYRGTGPQSEAETLALQQAVLLAGPDRLRLGVDVHSFSQVFFSSNTGISRLNGIQSQLLGRLSSHHKIVSRPSNNTPGSNYNNVPDPPNGGMGVAAQYFSQEFLVPAWTLEIEPANSAAQYGGLATSHSGFILPDSEVRRVREAWAESHIVAFYSMAGAPYLKRVRFVDSASGAVVVDQAWQRNGAARERVVAASAGLQPGRSYRLELVFSKPMRVDGSEGPSGFVGLGITRLPTLSWFASDVITAIDASAGQWQANGDRYAYDTFVLDGVVPSGSGTQSLLVDVTDASGHKLDADPRTPVDWANGAWTGWESTVGVTGDAGGVDGQTSFSVGASGLVLGPTPAMIGEGESVPVVLERTGGNDAALRARLVVPAALDCGGTATVEVQWNAGETGPRTLQFCAVEDTTASGQLSYTVEVQSSTAQQPFGTVAALQVVVVDNDLAGAVPVLRGRGVSGLAQAIVTASQRPAGTDLELVLDGGLTHLLQTGPVLTCDHNKLIGPLRVYGSHATVRFDENDADCSLLSAAGVGKVELRDMTLLARRAGDMPGPQAPSNLLLSTTDLDLRNVLLSDGANLQDVSEAEGMLLGVFDATALLERVAIAGSQRQAPSATQFGGDFSLASSALVDLASATLLRAEGTSAGTVHSSTFMVERSGGSAMAMASGSAASLDGNLLQESGSAGSLCASGADPTSAGHNVAEDTSCALSATGDQSPVAVPAGEVDALTGVPFPTGAAIDIGGACPPVDLRGAPRPQTLVDGGSPLCDAGAIELGINPYRGLWLPDRPGHGIDIHTVGNVLFLTWYTYAEDGTPAAYLANAPVIGPVWRATLSSAKRNADGSIEEFAVGEIELDFASDTAATLRWRFGQTTTWSEEGLQAYFFAEGSPRMEATGTWYPPAEPGYGLTVTRRGAVTGLVLYYYDAEGTLRWALANGGDGDVLDVPLLGFTGFCPDCDAEANPPVETTIGTLRIQFLTPQRARLWVDVGTGATGRFQRSDVALVPINDPVDNRRVAP